MRSALGLSLAVGAAASASGGSCAAYKTYSTKCFAGTPTKTLTGSLDDCCSQASQTHMFNYFESNSTCYIISAYAGTTPCDGKLGYSAAPPPSPTEHNCSHYDDVLLTRHRPPRQTPAQAAAMRRIEVQAAANSSAARQWVLEYMGSPAVRSRLDASLQKYSNEELLEIFIWEFERLQLFHNAPASGLDADSTMLQCTETDLNVTLSNGYMQDACIRYVLGGPHPKQSVDSYSRMFTDMFGVPTMSATTSMRKANDCLLFLADNLRKTSGGNIFYGGFTYVLNQKEMKGRLIFEAWDAGLASQIAPTMSPPLSLGLGTAADWLHLVQPHEEMWNTKPPASMFPAGMPCCNYSLAFLLNRWLVPGTPVPDATSGGTEFMASNPYFEVMANGNVWLPEDLLYSIAQFANSTITYGGHAGLFGTPLGDQLRDFSVKNKRPLVWANGGIAGVGGMLIDPVVGNIAGGRITEQDRQLFKTWTRVDEQGWAGLFAAAPAHLKLSAPSFLKREVCAEAEKDPAKQVMGTDGEGNCVYWLMAAPAAGGKWEVLNDGSCVQVDSERGVYASQAECLAANRKWKCVADIPGAARKDAHYCIPSSDGEHDSVDSCEAQCGPGTAVSFFV